MARRAPGMLTRAAVCALVSLAAVGLSNDSFFGEEAASGGQLDANVKAGSPVSDVFTRAYSRRRALIDGLDTMTAPGGAVLKDDPASAADPEAGLWGNIEAVAESRHVLVATGGDPRPRADGTQQGNRSFRRLTVQNGDNFFGERAELGRNERRNGENTGTQTAGTFVLYREGDRRITFFSMRFGAGFTSSQNDWQTIMQMKQTQPYAANGPINTAPALEMPVYGGRLRLHSFWQEKWSIPAPANGRWFRVALDVTYSRYPGQGKVQMFIDVDNDGDADFVSPVLTMQTLAHVTQAGAGLAVGDPIPGHLRLGIYHGPAAYGTATVDVDNVQVVG